MCFWNLMHHSRVQTNITLDDGVHQFALIYADAKGITLSTAISELIRKAAAAPFPEADIRRSASGLAMFPPTGKVLTAQVVNEAESEI